MMIKNKKDPVFIFNIGTEVYSNIF